MTPISMPRISTPCALAFASCLGRMMRRACFCMRTKKHLAVHVELCGSQHRGAIPLRIPQRHAVQSSAERTRGLQEGRNWSRHAKSLSQQEVLTRRDLARLLRDEGVTPVLDPFALDQSAVDGIGGMASIRLSDIKSNYHPDLLTPGIVTRLKFSFLSAVRAGLEMEMGKCIQAAAFTAIAAAASAAWSQATPDLYDSAGKAVGQYKGDSVVISYNNQPLRIYTDAHWDYSQGRPVSSGLTWKHVPLYYTTPNCTGQAYIGTSPTAPTAQGSPAPTSGPPYSPPAYGSQYLAAPSKQGTQWTAHVSAQNPTYAQVAVQSERQYDGSCAPKSYVNLWTTPVQATVPLDTYGVPPFYAR